VPITVEHTAVCRQRQKLSFPGVVARFVRSSKDHHIHLSLLTTLEIAAHREWHNIASPSYKGLLKDYRIVCDTYSGLLGSVSKHGQYSETMTQLAKFSGPTAANGRHYRQRHAASGLMLSRLNYYQVNTVTSGRRQNDIVLVGNTSASVADVATTSRRHHCATEPRS